AAPAEAAWCTVAASSVNFGNYNVFDAQPTDSTATITLNCGGNVRNVAIMISRGGGTLFYSYRFMNKFLELLFYNLYLDASRTVIWGDGSGGSEMEILSSMPNNREVDLTVYG